jgi:uncharacterized membrane protein
MRAAALIAVSVLTLAACGEAPEPASAPVDAPASAETATPATTEAPSAPGDRPIAAAPPAAAPSPAAAKAGPPVLNRVNLESPLRLVGTEPFWGADLGDGRLVLEAPDRETVRLAVGRPVMRAGEATWRAANTTITVTAEPCSDGMSDRTYPLTATVRSGGITWKGCAANAAAFRRAVGRESGEVR